MWKLISDFCKNYKNIFLFGFFAGLAFAPFYLIFFLPISFYYIINKVLESNSKKQAFIESLIFGFGYYLIQVYWVSFSLTIDIKTYFWLFPFAITLIPLACAFYFASAVLIFFYIYKKYDIKNDFILTVIFSLLYVISEYIKGLIFPWNLFSYILGFSDILIQIASLINIYVLDFILILFFCFGFVIFEYKNKRISFKKNNKYYIFFYIFILIFIILFGIIRLHKAEIKKFNLTFRLVQANISQTMKWDRNEMDNNIQKHNELTQSAGFDKINIIVWAESSIPYLLLDNSILPEEFLYLKEKVLITGAVRANIENNKINKIWNSIFIFRNGKIIDYYDKSKLVPFGEYIPFSKYIPFAKKITNGAIDFSMGNGNKTIRINGIKISPIICYEIAFPDGVIDKNNKPDLIINLTNDAWFGRSSEPYQHLVSAKFRAVENKIPVIRVSNDGISAYIDRYGRIIKKIKLNKTGIIDIDI